MLLKSEEACKQIILVVDAPAAGNANALLEPNPAMVFLAVRNDRNPPGPGRSEAVSDPLDAGQFLGTPDPAAG